MNNINCLSIAAVLAGALVSTPLLAASNHIDNIIQEIEQEKITTNIKQAAIFPILI